MAVHIQPPANALMSPAAPWMDWITPGTTHTDGGTYNDTWVYTDTSGNYTDTSGPVQECDQPDRSRLHSYTLYLDYDGLEHTAAFECTGLAGDR